jgi:uncharacterized membrane protein
MSRALYMDAEIRPNRSLSRRGFIVLFSLISALNVACALVFVLRGAVLVPFFMGAGEAGVAAAFLASFRAARVVERVQVSAAAIRVTQETPRSTRLVWESPTAFTRVATERDEDNRVTGLALALSGRTRAVAAALSPRERGEFGRALEDAIYRARRGG